MVRDESWVNPGDQSPELLRHEQGHLDIAEIQGRRAQFEIRKLVGSGVGMTRAQAIAQATKDLRAKIQLYYSGALVELDRRQKAYDDYVQPNGKPDLARQAEYDHEIGRALRHADGYLVDENLQPR